ncbi:MAG: aminoacyl-tRNA hydrolase [Sphaerochaetaceae bacterium]
MNKLLVFLGNPGSQYRNTRHNAGWLICDVLGIQNWQKKFHGTWSRNGSDILLKPETFMNESGISVREAMDFFKLKPEDIVVFHDDTEIEFTDIRLQIGGPLRGQNGLRSIQQHLGTDGFGRLRFGIGRPKGKQDLASYVLSGFSDSERAELPQLLEKAALLGTGKETNGDGYGN